MTPSPWRAGVLSRLLRLAALWFTLSALAHVLTVRLGLTQHIAAALGGTLRAIGVPAVTSGTAVLIQSFRVEIIEECTGLSLAAALVAFACVVPTSWRRRALGALLLFTIAEAWNAIRLVALAVVGWRWPGSIHFVHDVVWQIATVALAIAAAAAWARRVT